VGDAFTSGTAQPCSGHTPLPDGYVARAERHAELLRTHVQTRCPDCGRWAIWVPKAPPTTVGDPT